VNLHLSLNHLHFGMAKIAVPVLNGPVSTVPARTGSQREWVATLQLFFSTTLFGVSFIGQKIATTRGIGPFTYTACRFVVSTVLLYLFRPLIQLLIHSEIDAGSRSGNREPTSVTKELYKWAPLCGLAAFAGSNLQQIGLTTVSAGKTAFITGMYVIFVPIVEWALPGFGLKLSKRVWISAVISLVGMFFLSGDMSAAAVGKITFLSAGEIIVFISMLFWVISIISADIGTKRGVDGVSFTLLEFAVSTALSIVLAVIFEWKYLIYPFESIVNSWEVILLVGFTEGASFLFGTLGQMYTSPSKAALIYSLESVTAAVGAYFFLGEVLTVPELFGCVLMLSAAIFCSYESETQSGVTQDVEYISEISNIAPDVEECNNFLRNHGLSSPHQPGNNFEALDSSLLLDGRKKAMYST
jgi:drug/metabolite transporter (DMT)-like permease